MEKTPARASEEDRALAATWYAWGRKDEAAVWSNGTSSLRHADVFEFADYVAGETREYHDPNHARTHLKSVQDQWQEFLKDRRIIT